MGLTKSPDCISFMGLKWKNCSVIGPLCIHTLAVYSFFFWHNLWFFLWLFSTQKRRCFPSALRRLYFFYGCRVNLSWRINHPSLNEISTSSNTAPETKIIFQCAVKPRAKKLPPLWRSSSRRWVFCPVVLYSIAVICSATILGHVALSGWTRLCQHCGWFSITQKYSTVCCKWEKKADSVTLLSKLLYF